MFVFVPLGEGLIAASCFLLCGVVIDPDIDTLAQDSTTRQRVSDLDLRCGPAAI
jgi:hypothetical protein